jgi:hypothetical protein
VTPPTTAEGMETSDPAWHWHPWYDTICRIHTNQLGFRLSEARRVDRDNAQRLVKTVFASIRMRLRTSMHRRQTACVQPTPRHRSCDLKAVHSVREMMHRIESITSKNTT